MQGVRQERVEIPATIETPRAKLVYLALAVRDGASTTELQELLSMRKLTLLSILDSLDSRGLVEVAGREYRPC